MSTRIEQDRGAIAIVAVILALTIFGVSALAVDIGNMYSRKRMTQTTADLAALAGAGALPDVSAAFDAAYDYLDKNYVAEGTYLKDELRDNNVANGEISVDASKLRVTVVVPPRRVQFGLAAALGYSSSTVSARAVAGLRSPGRIMPFFVPTTCAQGYPSLILKATGSPGYQYDPPSSNGNIPQADSANPPTGESPGTTAIEVEGTKFASANMVVVFTPLGGASVSATPTTITLGTGPIKDRLTVPVPPTVLSNPGTWHVRAGTVDPAAPTNQALWRVGAGVATFTVTVNGQNPQCGYASTGDFGLLNSPRKSGLGLQAALDRNLADGIDHSIVQHPRSPPADINETDNCREKPGLTPIADGVLDNDANLTAGIEANCLNIENGNKVDAATDGLILGGSDGEGTYVGKLRRPNGITTCNGPGGTPRTTVLARDVSNEIIDCYLKSGSTVSQLTSSTPPDDILNGAIFQSPRFFLVPVIHYVTNPPNGYYPIVGYRGAFITDQRPGLAATAANGLQPNNANTKLDSVQVLLFKTNALSDGVGSGNGSEYQPGGAKAVRLIE